MTSRAVPGEISGNTTCLNFSQAIDRTSNPSTQWASKSRQRDTVSTFSVPSCMLAYRVVRLSSLIRVKKRRAEFEFKIEIKRMPLHRMDQSLSVDEMMDTIVG